MALTAAQIYLLNKMNSTANAVQLGTLLSNASDIVASEIALADGTILVGNAEGVSAAVTMSGDVTITNAGVAAIGAAKVTEAMQASQALAGLHSARVAHCIFDPSAVVGDRTIAAHTLGATIPNNSFVTGAWYWVETTLTSATDAATVALHVQAANDVVTAVAISDGGNPWDTTSVPVEGTPVVETPATFLKTTAARAVTATVAVEALTAGKIHVWVQYWQFA